MGKIGIRALFYVMVRPVTCPYGEEIDELARYEKEKMRPGRSF